MVTNAPSSAFRKKMTRADTTPVITWEKRSAILIGTEKIALGNARPWPESSPAMKTGTGDAWVIDKGHLVRVASKTGLVLAVLCIARLRITKSKVITSK